MGFLSLFLSLSFRSLNSNASFRSCRTYRVIWGSSPSFSLSLFLILFLALWFPFSFSSTGVSVHMPPFRSCRTYRVIWFPFSLPHSFYVFLSLCLNGVSWQKPQEGWRTYDVHRPGWLVNLLFEHDTDLILSPIIIFHSCWIWINNTDIV